MPRTIGGDTNGYAHFDLAELLVYEHVLTDDERAVAYQETSTASTWRRPATNTACGRRKRPPGRTTT